MDKQVLIHHKETIKDDILNEINIASNLRAETEEYIEYALFYAYESFETNNQNIIIYFFLWLHTTLLHDGVSEEKIESIFDLVVNALQTLYGDNVQAFFKSLDYETIVKQSQSFHPDVHHEKYQRYLEFLLDKDKLGASQYVRGLLDDGVKVPEIYMDVIQPALYEIGWLWQTNKISVADEHLATVISQYIMTTMYPDIFSTEKTDKKVLGAAIGSELHEIGIRMVMDMFEYSGYQTQYLGANMPIDAFISYANDFQPDIIALSITLSIHVGMLKETIKRIRNHKGLKNVKILIGGQPLNLDDSLYKDLDADAFAKSAQEALEVGDRLVKQ